MRNPSALWRLLRAVAAEAEEQDAKWSWPRPDGFLFESVDPLEDSFEEIWENLEDLARTRFAQGRPSWLAIVSEELGEVAREDDPEKRVGGLVQAATCLLSWAQHIQEAAARPQREGESVVVEPEE